ncbi:tetratricopeptide repeat protein [Maricaulis sp.]|uniref:tetratricopeptide repeat protein n=1 Tax=Maricaulis sp. TaxID=1486257 RepID=UPI003297EAC6
MSQALQRALQFMQSGRPAEAISQLEIVLKTCPDDVEALHLRGIARGHLGQFEAGAVDLEYAAEHHTQPHAVLSNLGNLHRRAGDLARAVEAYRAALARAPDFIDARLNLAISLLDLGRSADAEAEFEAVLSRQPEHSAALNGLGNLYSRSGDNTAAIDFYTRAIEANPRPAMPYVNRGGARRSERRYTESLADLDTACRLAPGLAEGHFQRGHTLRMLGRSFEAREAYWEASRLTPDRADIHRDLAGLLWELGEGRRATAALDAVLERRPDPELLYTKARVLFRTGYVDDAAAALDSALARAPGHAAARALRGEISCRRGAFDDALNDLRRALDIVDGADFAIRHQLVEACLSAGEADEAIKYLQVDPPAEHLQKHVALQATAWRCAGDERYGYLYDFDRLTAKVFIDTPPGFPSLDAFNTALGERIERLHRTTAQPLEQTLFGGTQSPGRLWDDGDPVIQALARALEAAARRFVESLPDDLEHPFLSRKSSHLQLAGAWSVRLRSGGGHVDHIHPAGWISASYYVHVPDTVADGVRAGWLRLGAPGLPGLDLPAERYILPEAGAAIFFPSYMWHGVEPFESRDVRVTAPFDLLPQ